MQWNIFQATPFIGGIPTGEIFAAAKHRIANIRRTIFANNILYQRLKATIARRNSLRAYNRNLFHNMRFKNRIIQSTGMLQNRYTGEQAQF